MKKKSGSRIVHLFKRIINVRSWADWDRMKAFTLYFAKAFKKIAIPQQGKQSETFEAAVIRLNLSENDLRAKQTGLFRLSMLMIVAAFLILAYTIYLLIDGSFRAAAVSGVVMLISLTLAFRYHFWYFQIKVRQLGCSMSEWYRQGLLGDK